MSAEQPGHWPPFSTVKCGQCEQRAKDVTLGSVARDRLIQLLSGFSATAPSGKAERIPRSIVWRITGRCNLRCLHCSASASQGKSNCELEREKKLDLVKQIAQTGFQKVVISGGEPLLDKDFWRIITVARSTGLKVKVNSNGWLIHRAVAQRLRDEGVSTVQIALHGAHAQLHDTITGVNGSFQRAARALRLCARAGINTIASSVLTGFNYGSIVEIAEFAEHSGAHFYLKRLHPIGRAKGNFTSLAATPAEFRSALESLRSYYGEELVENFTRYLRTKNGWCVAYACPCIQPNGSVTPCAEMSQPVGNLAQSNLSEIWREIWRGETCVRIANREVRGKCSSCSILNVCGGGCRADAVGLASDVLAPDPYCWYGEHEAKEGDLLPVLNVIGLLLGWL